MLIYKPTAQLPRLDQWIRRWLGQPWITTWGAISVGQQGYNIANIAAALKDFTKPTTRPGILILDVRSYRRVTRNAR